MKPSQPDFEEFGDSSGDENINQYSVMKNNLNQIPMGSRIKNESPADTMGNLPEEEEVPEEESEEEQPLTAEPKKIRFEDPQTTQEEKVMQKSANAHHQRHSTRPSGYGRRNFYLNVSIILT
jgi:hypothetical protein